MPEIALPSGRKHAQWIVDWRIVILTAQQGLNRCNATLAEFELVPVSFSLIFFYLLQLVLFFAFVLSVVQD
jgi:hypothetical protein